MEARESGLESPGLGFRVRCSDLLRISALGFRIWFWLRQFRISGFGFRARISDLLRVLALGFRICCLLGLLVPLQACAADTKPNIVLILIDDLGWRDVGCNGSTFYQTPQIDRLASQGMRFTDAYTAGPVCSPTRASILTGRHPARLQLTDWLPGRQDRPSQKLLKPEIQRHLPLEEVTLAEALKDAGYVSASIGKWHLGGKGFLPQDQGFDLNVAGDETGSPLSYFAPFRSGARVMPGLEQSRAGEYLTDRLTEEAEKFIEANRDRPFFLYLAHYAVHIPLKAKQQLVEKYRSLPAPGPQTNVIYAAMMESVDESVGRIVRKLEAMRLTERTVIFLTSDNGGLSVKEGPDTPATSNAPLRGGKGYLYEGGIRVPLIVRWPGAVRTGSVAHVPVSSVDFFPTILEMAALKAKGPLDGVSLLPVLKESGALPRDALYWHYPHYSNEGGKPCGAVRQDDLKLIQFYEDGRLELYNLRADIGETNNLAWALPDKARALRTSLEAWRKTQGAQMMEPNPDYEQSASNPVEKVVPQMADGRVLLHARDAVMHGASVRYEPQPYKNTIGFWTRLDDWVSWDFEVNEPGLFTVEVLQGCAKASGGSRVLLSVGDQTLEMVVEETGGFQNFVSRDLGTFRMNQPGRYTLTVKARTKPGLAVMDLRSVTLRRLDQQ
jgi:arylsulfatase A